MKTSKWISLLLCLAILLCLFPAAASADASGTCGENLTWTFSATTGKLTITGSGAMKDYEYNSQPWAAVQKQIKSLSLPSGLTYIGWYAFDHCTALTSATIPGTVEKLGGWAFGYCSALTSLTIGNGVKTIGRAAFIGCTSLTSATVPASVTLVDDCAFAACTSMKTILVASGNTEYRSVDGVLFSYDKKHLIGYPAGKSNTSYTIPSGVTDIHQLALSHCNNLVSLTIPDSVWLIDTEAICQCSSLSSLTIGNGVTKIRGFAFAGCSSLTSVSLPASVTTVGGGAFQHCDSLTAIKVASGNMGFVSVDGVLFSKDKKTLVAYPADKPVTSYSIPDGVTTVLSQSFYGSRELSSLVLPASLVTVEPEAFWNCAVKDVYYYGTKAQRGNIDIGDTNTELTGATWHYISGGKPVVTGHPQNMTVYVGKTASFQVTAVNATGYRWQYQKPGETTWTNVSSNGTSSTYTLSTAARHNGYKYRCAVKNDEGTVYSNAATLTVSTTPIITSQPNNVTVNEGEKATFKVVAEGATSYRWQYLKPGENTWIDISKNGTSATYTLTAAARHNGYRYRCLVKNSNGSVYSYSATLTVRATSGSCGEKLTWTFDESAGKLTITGSGDMYDFSWETIPWGWAKSRISSISLPSGLTSIGNRAFEGCQITTLTIPAKVTRIGNLALEGCWSLTSIKVASGSKSFKAVSGVLFSYDQKTLILYPAAKTQTSYAIPSGVTVIDDFAFSRCESLTSITIPSGVTSIGRDAFEGCSGLTSLTLPSSLTHIGWYAFVNCCGLASITVPAKVTEIEDGAFTDCWALKTIKVASGSQSFVSVDGVLFTKDKTELVRYPEGKEQTSYTIPDGVTFIRRDGMSDTKLETLTVPASLTHVGLQAFSGSDQLKTVYYRGTEAQKEQITVDNFNTSLTSAAWKYLPVITAQPQSVTVGAGAKATFRVTAANATSYKWQYQKPGATTWTNVSSNGTSAKYTLTVAAKHNGYKYRCLVKNADGSVYSNVVTLTVANKPTITTQPKAVTVAAGRKATFKVVAEGATSYRWQYQKFGSTTWTDVSKNGTSATYSLTAAAKHNGYSYRCKITNEAGSVYTDSVTLTVIG